MRKLARAYRDFYQKHEKEAANAVQEQEKHWLNKIFFGLFRLFFHFKITYMYKAAYLMATYSKVEISTIL